MTGKRRRTVFQQLLGVAFKVAEENERLRRGLTYYADPTHWREGLDGEFSLRPPWLKPTEVASKSLEFRATYVTRPPSRTRGLWMCVARFFAAACRRICDRSPAHHEAAEKKRATTRAEK